MLNHNVDAEIFAKVANIQADEMVGAPVYMSKGNVRPAYIFIGANVIAGAAAQVVLGGYLVPVRLTTNHGCVMDDCKENKKFRSHKSKKSGWAVVF